MWNKLVVGSVSGGILAYFAPMWDKLIVLLVIYLVDAITGIAASRRQNVPISSRRMRDSVYKLIAYVTIVLLLFVSEKTLGSEKDLTTFAIGFIYAIEGLSILENFYVLCPIRPLRMLLLVFRGKMKEHNSNLTDDILKEKNDN